MYKESYYNSKLTQEKNIFEELKSEIGCFGCSNNYEVDKLNLKDKKKFSNEGYFSNITLQVYKDNSDKIKRAKKKWLPYHYEILSKCIHLFGNNLKKIMIFINEFPEKEIKKRIKMLKTYNLEEAKKRNSSASTYAEVLDIDTFDFNGEIENKNPHNQDFDLEEFMFNNLESNSIKLKENELNTSVNSNFTENFYENKNYNIAYDKEIDNEIDQDLNDIFSSNDYNIGLNDILYSY